MKRFRFLDLSFDSEDFLDFLNFLSDPFFHDPMPILEELRVHDISGPMGTNYSLFLHPPETSKASLES